MTKEREALKLTIEALECALSDDKPYIVKSKEAIAAGKEALAEPTSGDYALGYGEGFNDACKRQPEERNFCSRCGKRLASGFVEISIHTCTPPQPEQEPKTYALLYPQADYVATPDERPWVGLTVDELIDLERKHLSHENLTQAIEAKLKKKNT